MYVTEGVLICMYEPYLDFGAIRFPGDAVRLELRYKAEIVKEMWRFSL